MNAELEKNIGLAWFDGHYTEDQARLTTELQGLNWSLVELAYSHEYERAAKLGSESWN